MKIELHGMQELRRKLREFGDRQVPEAIAKGLNRTALAVERREKVAMAKSLDRPTPFTLNAVARWKATSRKLNAVIYIRPMSGDRDHYLAATIEGAVLRNTIVPVISNIRLDRHGNIRGKRGGLDRIAKGKKRFVAKIGGTTGVWERYGPKGRKLRLVAFVAKESRRTKRWDFYGVAERTVRERLQKDVRDAVSEAIRIIQ